MKCRGPSQLTLDGKGRFSMPSKYRDVLTEHSPKGLVITKHPHGCLMVFPECNWDAFEAKIDALPFSATDSKRLFTGSADPVELDSAWRITVSPELRDFAGLSKDLRMYGLGSHFELWDATRYSLREAAAMASAATQHVLQDLVI
ncbi:division/cell wall cluster transcriptional repressor MraZ [Amphibiibacter pelophylacis]|uniref:Division/cell wall cluster transcriptional repressor MraZ n=1 Tax=Amphibiibacter pelophylacis TaxID=1799477 RepID=A0ACC6P5G2_9BURK